jgi:hypothetical protein
VAGAAGTAVTTNQTTDLTFVVGKSDEVVASEGGTKANVTNEGGIVIGEGGSIPTDDMFLKRISNTLNASTFGPNPADTDLTKRTYTRYAADGSGTTTAGSGAGYLRASVTGGVLTIGNIISTGNRITLSDIQHDLLANLPQASGVGTLATTVGTEAISAASNIASDANLSKPFETTVAGTPSTFNFVPTESNSTILSQLANQYDSISAPNSVSDPDNPININAYLNTGNQLVIANGSSQDITITDTHGLLASIFGAPFAAPPSTITLGKTVTPASTSTVTTPTSTTKIAGILTGSILAVSRAIGETAPLVVIGASTFIQVDPEGPFSKFTTLPAQIYQWTVRPQGAFHNIAAAASLVLLILLLALNATAIVLRNRYSRRL